MKKKIALILAAALFVGTAPLSVYGAQNQSASKTAQAKSPYQFEITSNEIQIGTGTRNTKVDDIVIREAEPGLFKRDKIIYLQGEHLQFEDGAECIVEAGDIKIRSIKAEGDILKIEVERSSSKEPAVLRLTNLSLFLDQALPEGDYSMNLITEESSRYKNNMFGENYSENGDDQGKFDVASVPLLKDYVRLVTPHRTADDLPYEVKGTVIIPEGQSVMYVNGQTVTYEGQAYMQNEQVMLPVRAILQAKTANPVIGWNEAEQSVVVSFGSRIAQFQIGGSEMNINGVKVVLTEKPVIKEGVTYLSLKDLANIIGLNDSRITWDTQTKTATLE